MPTTYRRLCQRDRDIIYRLRQQGRSQTEIAKTIGFSPSAISRELKRNTGGRGYRPKQAGRFAGARRFTQRREQKINDLLGNEIEARLQQLHSPEQISGAMRKEGWDAPSHETIYNYIARDKQTGGNLYLCLRINGTRRYRRRSKAHRSKIPGRVDITERPSSVEARTYYGDWEIDLVEGKKGTGFILSMVERKSRYSLFEALEDKKATTVAKGMIRRLRPFKTRTLTYDNGLEFAKHLEVGRELGAKSYFCAPYHAWEKGLVENHNGLLRQYYPKGESFSGIKMNSLQWVEREINERPRKTLEYACPMLYLHRLIAA